MSRTIPAHRLVTVCLECAARGTFRRAVVSGACESHRATVPTDSPTVPPVEPIRERRECMHCFRHVEQDDNGIWRDPHATGDDSIWEYVCDRHDTFQAEHEVRP